MSPVFAYPIKRWNLVKDPSIDGVNFLDPAYLRSRGYQHPGTDYNLVTGGDTDLGVPIRSMFPGKVVAAQWFSTWGNNVLVRADEWVRAYWEQSLKVSIQSLEALYAHLHQIEVRSGEHLEAGEALGSMGKGDPAARMYAHLHLEIRIESRRADEWVRDPAQAKAVYQATRLDPQKIFQRLMFAERSNLGSLEPTLYPAKEAVLLGQRKPLKSGQLVVNLEGETIWTREG